MNTVPDADREPCVTGFVSVTGKPNVGKSSLVNHFVGRKVSITSRRPQTTRNRLLGIRTTEHAQVVFVDAPGIHAERGKALNRVINKTATGSLEGVDVVLMMISTSGWTREDTFVYGKVRAAGIDAVLAVNKVDVLKDRERLLPFIDGIARERRFVEIVPVSVKSGYNMERLFTVLVARLPEGRPGFPREQVTDRSQRFLAGELVREKMFRQLREELPYSSAVEIPRFEIDRRGTVHVDATIWVEKPGQKAIVIGRNGAALKRIGQHARREMERMFQRKVYLECWVKVRKGWTDDVAVMKSLGYDEL